MYRFLVLVIISSSCTVTNNMFVNDPVCEERGSLSSFVGIGMGFTPKIDSVRQDGNIDYSGQIRNAPILSGGIQYALTNLIQLRGAVHLPYIVGGFGGRGGIQFSPFNGDSKFNAALGVDFGGVAARDSIRLLGSKREISIESNGGIQSDFYLPLSIATSDDSRIIFTPRLSYTEMYIRKNSQFRESRANRLWVQSFSVAVRKDAFYLEFTALRFGNDLVPSFGLAYLL